MWALATYWHTSMADRYDINDISELSFVSTLFESFACHYEFPSRSISWVKLYLSRLSFWSNDPSYSETTLCVNCLFPLTSRPCPILKFFRLIYSCVCVFHSSSAFSQRGWGSGSWSVLMPTVWLWVLFSPYHCIKACSSLSGTRFFWSFLPSLFRHYLMNCTIYMCVVSSICGVKG